MAFLGKVLRRTCPFSFEHAHSNARRGLFNASKPAALVLPLGHENATSLAAESCCHQHRLWRQAVFRAWDVLPMFHAVFREIRQSAHFFR